MLPLCGEIKIFRKLIAESCEACVGARFLSRLALNMNVGVAGLWRLQPVDRYTVHPVVQAPTRAVPSPTNHIAAIVLIFADSVLTSFVTSSLQRSAVQRCSLFCATHNT